MPGMTWKARTCSAVPVSYTALLIAQRDVDHTRFAFVEGPVGGRCVVERELGGGQRTQGQLAEQGDGDLPTSADVPATGQRGGDGRHLAAADGRPAAVERTAERQLDRAAAVPRPDERGALVGQQAETSGQRGGRARELQEQ